MTVGLGSSVFCVNSNLKSKMQRKMSKIHQKFFSLLCYIQSYHIYPNLNWCGSPINERLLRTVEDLFFPPKYENGYVHDVGEKIPGGLVPPPALEILDLR